MAVQLLDSDDRIAVKDSELTGVTDGDPETTYLIRPIAVDDHRRIVKAHTTDVVNRRTHQKEPQVDWAAVNDDILDFVLVDWTGIHLKGQPVACSREYKLKLDGVRRQALADVAGMNQIARAPEVRAESFREPADLPAVLGR